MVDAGSGAKEVVEVKNRGSLPVGPKIAAAIASELRSLFLAVDQVVAGVQ